MEDGKVKQDPMPTKPGGGTAPTAYLDALFIWTW